MATRVETETTVGQALPSLVKDVSQRRIDAYSGVRPRSIHSDEAWARQKAAVPNFAEYDEKTARKIPVIRLDRQA